MAFRRIFLSLSIIFLIASFDAYGQFFKSKKNRTVSESPDGHEATYERVMQFPFINERPFYFNEKKLKKIKSLEAQKDWKELYNALGGYIENFGIQNFYKNTDMLWRYAKLTELYVDEEAAKSLYRLVLRHHREDFDLEELEIYYDSISKAELEKYVPIDYYYELIEYRRDVDTLRPPRGYKRNMGHLINSKYSDYGPSLSADNNVLVFTSKRKRVSTGLGQVANEDIFYSKKYAGYWTEVKSLKDINTAYNEGSVCLSNDGTTMYFTRCDAPDTYGNCDLFQATLQPDSAWGRVRNLGNHINSLGWDSHPSLSHTEDTLYFASDRIGGFGLADIYYTVRDKNGEWGRAFNAGPIINSRNNEVSPFIHPGYDILYFSSNGHSLNFGGFDIYKSYRENGRWQEAKNIGPLVNGTGSEFYFTIDNNSEFLFYARSIENDLDNLDLYSFPLPMEGQPQATTTLSGSLREEDTGDPFERGIVSIIDLDNGVEVAPQYLSPNGAFEFQLINQRNYLLIIQSDEFFRIEELFYLDGDMEINKFTESISSKLKFETIEFDNNSAALKPTMYADLDKLANFLLDNPDFSLRISGHTDSDGSPEFNMKLSQERADAIMEYLTYFGGMPEHKITARGFGSTQLIVKEETEEDKAMNRRVEFELYRPSKEELDRMMQETYEEDDW
jgi:outer membrane protein OmpA-like peptidoglycan-associated protein